MNKFSVVLPLRAGSKRVPKKNVKTFAGIAGGITKIKIEQVLAMEGLTSLYITTDDDDVIGIARSFDDKRIIIDRRPEELCTSSTKIEDLISYIKSLVKEEHIFWVHATSPFVTTKVLESAWKDYCKFVIKDMEYDSLMSVTPLNQFLWSKKLNKVINNNSLTTRWPQTQDLETLYEINHAFYINSKQNYIDRIGKNPYCFELSRLESIDIDWPEDFDIAEKIYQIDIKNNAI